MQNRNFLFISDVGNVSTLEWLIIILQATFKLLVNENYKSAKKGKLKFEYK